MASRPMSKPSRPKSAYNIFFQTVREDVQRLIQKKTGKKGSYAQLSKLVGERWRNTSTHNKMHFESLAAKDKRRYGIELVTWYAKQEDESVPEPTMNDLNSGKPKKARAPRVGRQRPARHETLQMPKTETTDLQNPSLATSSLEDQDRKVKNYSVSPRPIEDIMRDPDALLRTLDTDEIFFLKNRLGVQDEAVFDSLHWSIRTVAL